MHPFHKPMVRLALRVAARQNGNPPEIHQLLSDRAAFDTWLSTDFEPAYKATADGKQFFAAARPTALPAGWFLGILNWIVANLPAIIAMIQKLFPHAPAMAAAPTFAFSWDDMTHILSEVLPTFGEIAADALDGMPLAALVAKYGQTALDLFQHIIGHLTA